MSELKQYRELMKECDDKILEALEYRYELVEKIMGYKEKHDLPIIQPEQEAIREKQVREKLQHNKYENEIYNVFEKVVKTSKKIQARKLFDYNILLIGFMGAGKSTVSDYLSTVFAMDVMEMDQIIVEREQMSIPDIFDTYGEQYFRDLETNLLIEIQSRKNVIVSCGGGVALFDRNVVEMKKNSRVVLLTAKPSTILERVKNNDDRPLLRGNKNEAFIEDLMEKRRTKYEKASDIVIETDGKSVDAICEEIIIKLCK